MQEEPSIFSLALTDVTKRRLALIAYWAKVFSITGAVFLLLSFARAVYTQLRLMHHQLSSQTWPFLLIQTLFMLVPAVALLYAYRFASRLKAAIETDDQEAFERSLGSLKVFFRYTAVLMILATLSVGFTWFWQLTQLRF